jgi:hypothetical protein
VRHGESESRESRLVSELDPPDPTAVIAGVPLPASGPSDPGYLFAVSCLECHLRTGVSRPPSLLSLSLWSPYDSPPVFPSFSRSHYFPLQRMVVRTTLFLYPTLDPLMGTSHISRLRLPNHIPHQWCRGTKRTAIPHIMDERRLRWNRYL